MLGFEFIPTSITQGISVETKDMQLCLRNDLGDMHSCLEVWNTTTAVVNCRKSFVSILHLIWYVQCWISLEPYLFNPDSIKISRIQDTPHGAKHLMQVLANSWPHFLMVSDTHKSRLNPLSLCRCSMRISMLVFHSSETPGGYLKGHTHTHTHTQRI